MKILRTKHINKKTLCSLVRQKYFRYDITAHYIKEKTDKLKFNTLVVRKSLQQREMGIL